MKKELLKVYVGHGEIMYYTKKYINGILNYLDKWLKNKDHLDIKWDEFSNQIEYIKNLPLGEKTPIYYIGVVYACGCVEQLPPDVSYMKGGKFELIDGDIIYRIYEKENCCNCDKVATIKNNNKPDSLLQQAIYSHGLVTGFSSNESWEDFKESFFGVINAYKNKGELCCSWKTQRIGGFGIFIQGEVTLASNRDMRSSMNKRGERIFDTDDSSYTSNIITSKEELDFSVWKHTEFFVIPKNFYGIWVKQWFYIVHKKEIDDFIKKEGKDIKVYILK